MLVCSQSISLLAFVVKLIKILDIMSFIQRLTKNTKSPYIKHPQRQVNPSQPPKKLNSTSNPELQYTDFHKNHTELKDMLKFLESPPQKQFDTTLHNNNCSMELVRKSQNQTMMQSTKQNIRKKIKGDDLKESTPRKLMKLRKISQQIQPNSISKHPFLAANSLNSSTLLKPNNVKRRIQESMELTGKDAKIFYKKPTNNDKMEMIQSKKGLQNIGNTCYMNAVLQSLFHYPDFTPGLQKQFYHVTGKCVVAEKYIQLYQGIMKKNYQDERDLSTLPLKQSVSKISSMFIDFQQEDAHEFLRKLLDMMHLQINRIKERPKYKSISFSLLKENLATIVHQYEKFYKMYDDSYIYDVFCGELCSFVNCSNCNYQSLTLECFLDLSLPLIKGATSVEELMSAYFDSELLCDYYKCEACHKSVKNSMKKIDLWNPPNNLIINLKRSQFGKKNVDNITIPINGLNMKKFMKNRTQKVQRSAIYRLRSIVHHIGAVDGGHYWATVRESSSWYKIDDTNVTRYKTTEIQGQLQNNGSDTAYLLFYELI